MPFSPFLAAALEHADYERIGLLCCDLRLFRLCFRTLGCRVFSWFSVFHVEQSGPALEKMREKGVRFLATSSHKGKPVAEADFRGPLCFFLGREGSGLPRELLKEMDETLAIPHSPRVESLNAGVAASILLYEASRQRAKR